MRRIVIGASVAIAGCGGHRAPSPARDAPVGTAKVERGALSATVSQDGILTYAARPDGSPFTLVNRAAGTYTDLPENGDRIGCGRVLYRVDNRPVLLLCGTVPTYRALHTGDVGPDVRQLNRTLHVAAGRVFSSRTATALMAFQRDRGMRVTGTLAAGAALFAPEPVRVAKVLGTLGGTARPGAPVLDATSGRLQVQVALDPSQQGEVATGDRAQITLPGNRVVSGLVERFGRVAQAPSGSAGKVAGATIPTYIGLDDVARARGLDQSPVGVDITTRGVKDALSVPATAVVGRGSGFAVEVVRADGRRRFVSVRLGLFDTGGGRVQIDGAVREGDAVVVPSL